MPEWVGMVKRPTLIPPPVPAVPLMADEPQFGRGFFQSSTPLKASRATRNHLLGTTSPAPVSVSSTIANSRPPLETMAVTLGV